MKKVLIVTYYWPPAGGPGVQRWLQFVRHLPAFDIHPVLFIPENPHYPLVDTSFLELVPEKVTIYKGKIWEPYAWASFLSTKKTNRISAGIIKDKKQSFLEKVLLAIRGNLFIPDARKYWVKPTVNSLSEIITKESIDTIITTGPPHSVHLIGLKLKQQKAVRWIADFRDPWTSIGYHKKLKLLPWAKRKHLKLEKEVLSMADDIITTSNTTASEFRHIVHRSVHTITNGFETVEIKDVKLDEKFSISHIGSLLSGRNPEVFWSCLAELCKEVKGFKEHLQLKFIGVVSDQLKESVSKFNLDECCLYLGYKSHSEALVYQKQSQILLLVEINSLETTGIIPGKLFEYFMAERPILGIGPVNWEVTKMINDTQTGKVFTYTDKTQLKSVVLNWYNAFLNNSLKVDPKGINAYSRLELTSKLATIIHGNRI